MSGMGSVTKTDLGPPPPDPGSSARRAKSTLPDLRLISTQTKLPATLGNNLENLLIACTLLLHYTAIRYPLPIRYPSSIHPVTRIC